MTWVRAFFPFALPFTPPFPLLIAALAAFALMSTARDTRAQGWKPERPVEIIVGCTPGCGPDNIARVMQRIFQTHRYLDAPLNIQNRAGAGGGMARTYLNQFEGNGHYLYHGDKGILAARALGRSVVPYTDLTPVAILFGEYIGVAVKADSTIASGADLIERLKKDPTAHSVGIATSLGNINHQGVAGALKLAGIDIKKMRTVTFPSGAAAITAMLGGHIDVVPVSIGLWVPHMKTGAVRVIALAAGERQPGFFSTIPTWREQGANSVVFNWRAMWGPKGMTPAQVAWWDSTFQRLLDTPEWKAEMTLRNGVTKYTGAPAMRKLMEEEYPEVRSFLVELELAKP